MIVHMLFESKAKDVECWLIYHCLEYNGSATFISLLQQGDWVHK